MCGKFTAMGSWRKVFEFSQPLTVGAGADDEIVTYRPMSMLPVILYDRETKRRHIVPMRWGFPDPKNYKIPKHIHARAETIDTTKAFAPSFLDGRRGIVVMQTFNEGKVLENGKTEQWTIDPGDGLPRGFAFICQGYDIENVPMPLLCCVMVTVRANELIRSTIMQNDLDPRMPAILEDADWDTWLGATDASPDEVKAVLKTMDGVNWTMAPEPKAAKPPKPKRSPTEPQPTLF